MIQNHLPIRVKEAEPMTCFKRQLIKYLKIKCLQHFWETAGDCDLLHCYFKELTQEQFNPPVLPSSTIIKLFKYVTQMSISVNCTDANKIFILECQPEHQNWVERVKYSSLFNRSIHLSSFSYDNHKATWPH